MSVYINLPLSCLEKQLADLLNKWIDLELAEGDNSTALKKLSDLMKELGEAIEKKKYNSLKPEVKVATPSTLAPAVLYSVPARPLKRESHCRAFKKYGSCKKGNRCWWKHDPRYRARIKVANEESSQ